MVIAILSILTESSEPRFQEPVGFAHGIYCGQMCNYSMYQQWATIEAYQTLSQEQYGFAMDPELVEVAVGLEVDGKDGIDWY
jgi:hypothetical protein